MLEPPEIPIEDIVTMLRGTYGLQAKRVEFLPLGADVNTAVYRVTGSDTTPYFLKLRKANFEATSVLVPRILRQQGIGAVIAPLETVDGRPWGQLGAYTTILYPFVEGQGGFDVALTDAQWVVFGAALKGVHTAALPADLRAQIPVETYSPYWREAARGFLAEVAERSYPNPIAAKLAAYMNAHRAEIEHLIERAEALASQMQSRLVQPVLCHSDIHAGNLLLTAAGDLYIVDWDNPILAAKERDLMFIGGGVAKVWNSTREEALFYQGYGAAQIDLTALAYYRFERIVVDITEFCKQILESGSGDEDREQGFYYFSSQFLPGDAIDMALQTDRWLAGG
jgi:spectinomycin phosphotransferase